MSLVLIAAKAKYPTTITPLLWWMSWNRGIVSKAGSLSDISALIGIQFCLKVFGIFAVWSSFPELTESGKGLALLADKNTAF